MTRGKDSGAQKQVEERRLRPIYGEEEHELESRVLFPFFLFFFLLIAHHLF